MPYLSALEVRSRRGAIQIHVYVYLYLTLTQTPKLRVAKIKGFTDMLGTIRDYLCMGAPCVCSVTMTTNKTVIADLMHFHMLTYVLPR